MGAILAAVVACGRAAPDPRSDAPRRPHGRSSESAEAASGTGSQAARVRDVCALLSAQDVREITGVPIERVEKKVNGCEWYASAAAQQQQGRETARGTLHGLMKQEPKSAQDTVQTMENLVKGVAGAAAPDKPLFAASVDWENGDRAEVLLKGTVEANSPGVAGGLEPVADVGDRAFIGAMGMLFYARKGPALVTFGSMGITRDQEIALARKVVSKM